jgi:hypothetical protein
MQLRFDSLDFLVKLVARGSFRSWLDWNYLVLCAVKSSTTLGVATFLGSAPVDASQAVL